MGIHIKVPIRLIRFRNGILNKSSVAFPDETKTNKSEIFQERDVEGPTVNSSIIRMYKEMSSTWWVTKSPISLVYELNKLRIPWIVDTLTHPNAVSPNAKGLTKPLEGLDILDAGCGGGYLTEPLAEFGCNIVGIDPCAELINIAKEHLRGNPKPLNVTYDCETIESHSDRNHEKYDVVIASQVLPFLEKPDLFIEKCSQCLKPGGSMFITTLNKTVLSYVKFKLGMFVSGLHQPLITYNRFNSKDDIVKCITHCNCSVHTLRGIDFIPILRVWKWRRHESMEFAIHAKKHEKSCVQVSA